ncbi:hypothetical protein NDU88_000321 [Pleurodeles waltl]|uniref:Uncharacterized protein n=1 Tax=Pleurodeles waltl TaxID=8319 RepID=A0AAV7N7L5_PLEWA|nr:hypothetical protein NDU88_000321 [Pleurodeles waltl]
MKDARSRMHHCKQAHHPQNHNPTMNAMNDAGSRTRDCMTWSRHITRRAAILPMNAMKVAGSRTHPCMTWSRRITHRAAILPMTAMKDAGSRTHHCEQAHHPQRRNPATNTMKDAGSRTHPCMTWSRRITRRAAILPTNAMKDAGSRTHPLYDLEQAHHPQSRNPAYDWNEGCWFQECITASRRITRRAAILL